MSALAVAGVVFLCLFGAALIGTLLRVVLPDHHLSPDSKDVIKLATAVVATLSALALGLLVASAKTAYEGAETELRTTVAHLLLLDRVMEHYGPETGEARSLLRKLVEARLLHVWETASEAEPTADDRGLELVEDKLRGLSPQTDAQRSLQSRALQVSEQLAEAHWLLIEMQGEGLPLPFLAILVFWLALLFFIFGLLAPGNITVICTLFASALSVAGAVFLIIDMAHPYLGLVHVSDAPLRTALDRIGR
jgi:hypothetical protein